LAVVAWKLTPRQFRPVFFGRFLAPAIAALRGQRMRRAAKCGSAGFSALQPLAAPKFRSTSTATGNLSRDLRRARCLKGEDAGNRPATLIHLIEQFEPASPQRFPAMSYGLYISAAGADVQSERIQIISNNLANVTTPGFMRELALVQARNSEAVEQGLAEPGTGSINDVGGGLRIHETLTQYAPGVTKATGIATDAALVDTPGKEMSFFVIENDGKQYLTRAGNFQFAPNGELQTQQGFRVMSVDDEPVVEDPGLGAFQGFSEDGAVRQQFGVPALLKIVRPASRGDLVRAGENLFKPLADVEEVPFNERNVKGGYLEMSSVSSYREMLQMIEASRVYESNIRLMQYQDSATGALINRLMRQS
jgi:flagellar basal body rod protein FlgG